MTYDFSAPICCMGKKCVRERARKKWVYIQQFVQNFLLEQNTCQFGVPAQNSNILGSQIGLTHTQKKPHRYQSHQNQKLLTVKEN